MTKYFKYGDEEINFLKNADPKFAKLIDHVGLIKRELYPDLFYGLVHSIVGQQISNEALKTVFNRVLNLVGVITPKNVLKQSDDALRSAGLSFKKVSWMKSAARRFLDGEFEINDLKKLSDGDLKKKLRTLDGVGEWTAEMLMLFCLKRKDILAFNDFGIILGLKKIYHLEKIDRKTFNSFKSRFSPYGSIASFYLWKVGNGEVSLKF